MTLTAYGAAGDTYQFTGQVAGALTAPLGQGGRIVAAYANAAGQSAGEDLLWQNPTNFNGTLAVQQTVTANANATTLRLALTAVLDAGHLDFGDFNWQRLAAGAVIRRSTYMLAGTARMLPVCSSSTAMVRLSMCGRTRVPSTAVNPSAAASPSPAPSPVSRWARP